MKRSGKHNSADPEQARRTSARKADASEKPPAPHFSPASASIGAAASAIDGRPDPTGVLALQRTAGNRAANRLLADRVIQAKRATRPAGVAREGEAGHDDHRAIATPTTEAGQDADLGRPAYSVDDAMRASLRIPVTQRRFAPDAERLQFGSLPQGSGHTGLPDLLKSGIESLSGISMDRVKVHYNSSQPLQLNALAYARGDEIHIAPGQERYLPHEAWHVAQQAEGRVRPTTQPKDGIPVNDDEGLEREADVMGARAVERGKSAPGPQRPESAGQRVEAVQSTDAAGSMITTQLGGGNGNKKGRGGSGAKAPKAKAREIGGALLSWEPKTGTRLIRYAEAQEVGDGATYVGREDNKAVWMVDDSADYDPSMAETRPYLVTLEGGLPADVEWVNFEAEGVRGEAGNPDTVILKESERGAYGIGRNLLGGLIFKVEKNARFKQPAKKGGGKKKK